MKNDKHEQLWITSDPLWHAPPGNCGAIPKKWNWNWATLGNLGHQLQLLRGKMAWHTHWPLGTPWHTYSRNVLYIFINYNSLYHGILLDFQDHWSGVVVGFILHYVNVLQPFLAFGSRAGVRELPRPDGNFVSWAGYAPHGATNGRKDSRIFARLSLQKRFIQQPTSVVGEMLHR